MHWVIHSLMMEWKLSLSTCGSCWSGSSSRCRAVTLSWSARWAVSVCRYCTMVEDNTFSKNKKAAERKQMIKFHTNILCSGENIDSQIPVLLVLQALYMKSISSCSENPFVFLLSSRTPTVPQPESKASKAEMHKDYCTFTISSPPHTHTQRKWLLCSTYHHGCQTLWFFAQGFEEEMSWWIFKLLYGLIFY